MATDILQKYGTSINSMALLPSGGGVFEITKNGNLKFSKKKEGRFPEQQEVFDLLES